MELLTAVCKLKAHNQLRTVEQLGYSVHNGQYTHDEVLGWYLRIQSPSADPPYLEERMLKFLDGLGKYLIELTDAQLEDFRSTVKARLLEPPKTLQSLFVSRWAQITRSMRHFSINAELAAMIDQISQDDLIQMWRHNICPSGMYTRRLVIHLWANGKSETDNSAPPAEHAETYGNGYSGGLGERVIEPVDISNVMELKSLCWHFYPFKCCVKL